MLSGFLTSQCFPSMIEITSKWRVKLKMYNKLENNILMSFDGSGKNNIKKYDDAK